MSTLNPPRLEVQAHEDSRLRLANSAGTAIRFFVLERGIIRVLVLPQGDLRDPAAWSVASGGDDTPLEGCNCHDLSGFTLPIFALHNDADALRMETSEIRLSVTLADDFCAW